MRPRQSTSQSGSRARCASVSTHTAPSSSGPSPHMRRPTQAIHLTHRSGPCLLPCGAPAWFRGRRREGSPCECGRRRIARIVSQGFHRLFGGECSGSSGYIVVAAGREDSRGLGSPMTEPFPRRPRVLGSPRLVALAKEGVPPELGTRVRNPSTTRVRGAGVENPGPADRVVFECRPKRWVFPAGRRVGAPPGSGVPRGELAAQPRQHLLRRRSRCAPGRTP